MLYQLLMKMLYRRLLTPMEDQNVVAEVGWVRVWLRLADELLWRWHWPSFQAWLHLADQEVFREAQEAVVRQIIYRI